MITALAVAIKKTFSSLKRNLEGQRTANGYHQVNVLITLRGLVGVMYLHIFFNKNSTSHVLSLHSELT